MPWKVIPESGKFKVYKLGADNKPTGKPVGTHGTKSEAQAQMRAMYASEKPKKEATVPDSAGDVSSAEQATFPGLDEAITAGHEKDYYGNPVPVMVVESIGGPLTFADLMAEEEARETTYEMYDLVDKFSRLSRSIMASDVEDKAAALIALAKEYASLVKQKTSEDNDEKSNEAIARQIASSHQPAHKDTDQNQPGGDSDDPTTTKTQDLYIWKDGSTYRWVSAYSNNRRDSDNPPEIISTESHREFDQALEKGEWPMPELWLWHVPYPVGVTQYHAFDESTGFPVAAGVFNKGCEWAAEGVLKAGWDGVSHGMPSVWLQRDPADSSIIIRHRTKEITFLPTWAAANKLAFNIIQKESTMIDEMTKGLPAHKRDEFIAAFGEERVKQIEETLEATSKAADEAGVEKKEGETTPETQAQPEALTPDSPVVKAMLMVVERLEALETRLKELETKQVEEKEAEAEPFDLIAHLTKNSAIGQPTTKVRANSKEAKDKPEEAEQPSWTQTTMGMRLSLIDQLVNANQEYYNRDGGTN